MTDGRAYETAYLVFLLGGLLVLAWGILLSFTLNAKSPLLYVGEGVISFCLIVLFYFTGR